MRKNNSAEIGIGYAFASTLAAVAIGTAVPAYEQLPESYVDMQAAKTNSEAIMERLQANPDANRDAFGDAQAEFHDASIETGLLASRAMLTTLVAGFAVWGASRSLTRVVYTRRSGYSRLTELLATKR